VNTWSRINGRKGTGNPHPRYDHLNSQPGQSRFGRGHTAAYRDLLTLALHRGAITDMTATPAIDFLKSVVVDVEARLELRITAASYVAKYEARPLAARPWAPDLGNYRLRHDLKTTASCLEAHRQLAEDTLSGKIPADAASFISEKFILPRIPHLEISEVRQELEAFRQLVEQAREQKELEARLTTSGEYEVEVVTPPNTDADPE
jgi:hypothetical protein